jgi:ATP phosphoribosyltransferase regulatory subunit HisZ
MPNSATRIALQEAIEAEKAQAARRLRRYEEVAQKYNASQQLGGTPLSIADLLEWHSFDHQKMDEDKLT